MRSLIFSLLLFGFYGLFGQFTDHYQLQSFDGADTNSHSIIPIIEGTNNAWEIGQPGNDAFFNAFSKPNAAVTKLSEDYTVNDTSILMFKLHTIFSNPF